MGQDVVIIAVVLIMIPLILLCCGFFCGGLFGYVNHCPHCLLEISECIDGRLLLWIKINSSKKFDEKEYGWDFRQTLRREITAALGCRVEVRAPSIAAMKPCCIAVDV